MSKINAVRFINLNYNNNSIRISDETFQLRGQSTLLSLRNGGGKSVLVQMMSAPFVHKQYRKTKDRPFESYFTTSKPTFIMVEWELDDGAGYCLTGMMIRRSQVSEELSSEPLEIVNFISEYQTRCEHDIYNIPVVEKSGKEIVLKNYNACKQLFEMYKKDHGKKFFYYDMNNSAQSRQYFDKLSEYKIYYREWETIIRKVNLKESGLSELFSDCKNEKELIEKWFLDSIESKLNRDLNRMKEFQTIIEKYVRMYKDNKSKIERRDTILKFKEDMLEVEERAESYKKAEQIVLASENRIACFTKELSRLEEQAKQILRELEAKSQDHENELSHVLYEKLSMEVHELEDSLRFSTSNRDMIQMEMDALEAEIEKLEKLLHLYECALKQQEADEQQRECELLTQKIAVSRQNEKELEPQRRQIGAYLKGYYKQCLEEAEAVFKQTEDTYTQKQEKQKQQKEREEECQKIIEEMLVKITECETRKEQFNRTEETFNHNYNEAFARNILGDYEPGMLEIKKEQYAKQLTDLTRSLSQHIKEQAETEERKRVCERNREDKRSEKQNLNYELRLLQSEEKEFDRQIKERQTIMRYFDVEDSALFSLDKLLEASDRKLTEIDKSRSALVQERNELQKEWKKLTSGEVLELPQDFKELLAELDLHPVYGMNWLEKNGYSLEENKRFVRQQPFLPYSLILPKAEIKKLETHGKEIYTSFPIPLIERERLEEALLEEESSVLSLSGISFYLWFNEQLLDEEALKALLVQKEAEIQKKNEQIELRLKEYQEYTDKKTILKNQTVTKEALDKNRKAQEEMSENISRIEKEISELADEITNLTHTLDNLVKTIQNERQNVEGCKRRETDFDKFCESYESYQKDRIEIERCKKEKKRYEENKKRAVSMQEQIVEELRALELKKQELAGRIKELQSKQVRFASYDTTKEVLFEETPQELEARFEAITTRMSADLQELESQLEKVLLRHKKAQDELAKLQKKYRLKEDEWKDIIYSEKEYLHQEVILEDKNRQFKHKERLWNKEDKQIAVLSSKIVDKKKGISEQCGYEETLPKEEIHTTDFDATMNQLKYKITELTKERKRVEGHLQSLNENLSAFSEYQDFIVKEAVEWEEDFSQMNAKRLREFAGIMRRDYRHETEEKERRKDKLEAHLNMLIRKEAYNEDYYHKPLEAMLSVTEKADLVLSQLATTIQSYDSQIAKLLVDIAMVEKEKAKIEGLLEDYVKEVHNNMGKIDNNSTITVRERPIKMLRLQIPDWEENEGLYRQRLTDFMDELTKTGIEIYERNENAADYFSTRITTKNLYDTIVGVGNIQIKLYKIEEQREYPITWAEVARNSGGEGFLSAFVILSSLLHFMRRDETDIFADRNEGKVLVMDNPFAQTNAAHLLKPLMDIAKKTNTQLVCLSGLGGDSIYSRFDNIYVLNLVTASLRGGMQYLRGEHTRGVEEEVMVSSQIEVYEQQELLF